MENPSSPFVCELFIAYLVEYLKKQRINDGDMPSTYAALSSGKFTQDFGHNQQHIQGYQGEKETDGKLTFLDLLLMAAFLS